MKCQNCGVESAEVEERTDYGRPVGPLCIACAEAMAAGIDAADALADEDEYENNHPRGRHCTKCGDELGSEWDRATVHIDFADGVTCGGKIE